jgi:subtilisin family serine protease
MAFASLAKLLALFSSSVVASTSAIAIDETRTAPIVSPGVHRALRSQTTVNLVLTLKETTSSVLSTTFEAEFSSRGEKIAGIVESLELHANTTQTEVTKVLSEEADGLFTSARSFWISNQIYVQDATVNLLTKLASLSSIYEIREELVLPVPTLDVNTTATNTSYSVNANEWGVTIIDAPEVWDLGNTGEGIVVSHIDTGVRYTHTALVGSFRSSYGWYDPQSEKSTPYDVYGHGTHTMGTMVGSGGIGVAPGATWISCKGCRADGCYESELLACAEFILCPTDTSGNNKDCSKAPNVVGNSWGGGQGDTFYESAIEAWQAAGIIPVFSAGNDGPACTTANSPGDSENVIAVGATTSTDGLASYSSKGPSVDGLLKPDISAPGSSVRSSYYSSDTSYATGSGTSMACPHVTGSIALLLSANGDLTYDEIKSLLTSSTDKTISSTGYTCGGTTDATIPNNQFGYGRLNVLSAVTAA